MLEIYRHVQNIVKLFIKQATWNCDNPLHGNYEYLLCWLLMIL